MWKCKSCPLNARFDDEIVITTQTYIQHHNQEFNLCFGSFINKHHTESLIYGGKFLCKKLVKSLHSSKIDTCKQKGTVFGHHTR